MLETTLLIGTMPANLGVPLADLMAWALVLAFLAAPVPHESTTQKIIEIGGAGHGRESLLSEWRIVCRARGRSLMLSRVPIATHRSNSPIGRLQESSTIATPPAALANTGPGSAT